VLAGFPEPSFEAPWRWIAATCIYAGLRPGEAIGLHKEDLDTRTWTLAVRHSWSEPLPKDGEARDVPVVAELRPHLLAAIAAARGALVFPRPDGSPRDPQTRWLLVDHLRRALKAAGVVDGYRYTCRRKGCGFSETREVASEDRCPRCSMRLCVSPVPRKVRFYDLRHTHATLLRRAGVDLGFVQPALGHSSPEITAAIYDHSDIEDFREAIERALSFGAPRVNAPVMQGAKNPKREGPGASEEPSDSGAFLMSGRLDLNQRPLAPQADACDRPVPPIHVSGRHSTWLRYPGATPAGHGES
jgi:integrase